MPEKTLMKTPQDTQLESGSVRDRSKDDITEQILGDGAMEHPAINAD